MKIKYLAVVLFLIFLLCGCAKKEEEDSGCRISYREFVTSGLRSYRYDLTKTEPEEQVEEKKHQKER